MPIWTEYMTNDYINITTSSPHILIIAQHVESRISSTTSLASIVKSSEHSKYFVMCPIGQWGLCKDLCDPRVVIVIPKGCELSIMARKDHKKVL